MSSMSVDIIIRDKLRPKLQALVYDILPLEEGAGKRCSESGWDQCRSIWFNTALHPCRKPEGSPRTATWIHTAPELWVTDYPVRRPNLYPPSTPHPPPMLGCTFLRLIKHTFLSSWRWQLQLTSAIVWTHYEFPIVFHAANTMSSGVAAIVLTRWQCSFSDGYVGINDYS